MGAWFIRMLKSRKFVMMTVGVAVAVGTYFGFNVPAEDVYKVIIAIIGVYIGGVAIEDHGTKSNPSNPETAKRDVHGTVKDQPPKVDK